MSHKPFYRGIRFVTVACKCGWCSEGHKSRGQARRSYEGHLYLCTTPRVLPFGVDARRRK